MCFQQNSTSFVHDKLTPLLLSFFTCKMEKDVYVQFFNIYLSCANVILLHQVIYLKEETHFMHRKSGLFCVCKCNVV